MKLAIALSIAAGLGVAIALNKPQPSNPTTAPSPTPVQKSKPKVVTKPQSTNEQMSRTGIPGLTMQMEWRLWRAYIRTIYYAEGTLHAPRPYNTQFTFAEFDGFDAHPEILQCAGSLCSDASGAGQWLSTTWKPVAQRCGYLFLKNKPEFSPENQDLAMLCHLAEIGTVRRLLAGVAVANGKVVVNYDNFVAAAINNCPVWASWPSNEYDTNGCYGQGAKSVPQLWKVFQQELAKEQGS